MGGDRGHPRFPGARKWLATSARKCGMRNGEGEMAVNKCRMADDKCRMADGDNKCRDETGYPRFPGARKWVAPSAFPPGTSSKNSAFTRRPVNRSTVARSARIRNGSIMSNTSDGLL